MVPEECTSIYLLINKKTASFFEAVFLYIQYPELYLNPGLLFITLQNPFTNQ